MITSNSMMTMIHGHFWVAALMAFGALLPAPFCAAVGRSYAAGVVDAATTIVDATSGAAVTGVPHLPQRCAFVGTAVSQLLHFSMITLVVSDSDNPGCWSAAFVAIRLPAFTTCSLIWVERLLEISSSDSPFLSSEMKLSCSPSSLLRFAVASPRLVTQPGFT